MPDKAYAIIHDGTFVLVARGGRSGAPPAQRRGSHLPGGTVPPNTLPRQQVMTEIQEETGFAVNVTAQTPSFQIIKGNTVLHFFVIGVASVPALVQQFQRPVVGNPNDEPFESVHAVTNADVLGPNIFRQADYTDWFGDGVRQANNLHLLA